MQLRARQEQQPLSARVDVSALELRIRNSITRVNDFVRGSGQASESLKMLSSSEKQHHLAEYRQSSAIERRLKAAHERYADACSAAEEVGQTQIHEADTIVQTSKLDRGHLFGSRYKSTSKFALDLPLTQHESVQPPQDERVLSDEMKKMIEHQFLVRYLEHMDVSPRHELLEDLRHLMPQHSQLDFKLRWRARGSTVDAVRAVRKRVDATKPTNACHLRTNSQASVRSAADDKGSGKAEGKRMAKKLQQIFKRMNQAKHIYDVNYSVGSADRAFHILSKDSATTFQHFIAANTFCRKQTFGKHKRQHSLKNNMGYLRNSVRGMFVMQSPSEDYHSEWTDDDEARSKEIRKPLLASLVLIQSLLNRCVEKVPLEGFNVLYSQSDINALAVILQHDATNELVAMLAHYAYWRLYGHQAGERLAETKIEHLLTSISSTFFAVFDAASLELKAYLFQLPLLIDCLHVVVKTLFAYQYPLTFACDSESSRCRARFDAISRLIDDVLQPPCCLLTDVPLERRTTSLYGQTSSLVGKMMQREQAPSEAAQLLKALTSRPHMRRLRELQGYNQNGRRVPSERSRRIATAATMNTGRRTGRRRSDSPNC